MMEDAMGRRRGYCIHRRCEPMELPMQTLNDLSRSLIALQPTSTLIAVMEMGLSSWLVAGIVPGIERQPLKKLAVDESALLRLLHRWREEAEKAGCRIERIVIAFEAGRDGFWLARWLTARSLPQGELGDKHNTSRPDPGGTASPDTPREPPGPIEPTTECNNL
jgi:hypothetical protein